MGAYSNPEYNTSVKSIPIYRLNKGRHLIFLFHSCEVTILHYFSHFFNTSMSGVY